jgi:benzoate-CoA ligase family protein
MPAPRFPDDLNLADHLLHDRLREGRGDHPAIRFGARSWTYADVAERTVALRRVLRGFEVPREHRVLIVLPDTPPFAWSIFATFEHGAVVAMGNPAAPVEELTYLVGYTRCAALITTPSVAASLAPMIKRSPELRAVLLVPDVATGDDPEQRLTPPPELADARCVVEPLADAIARGRRLTSERVPTRRDDVCMWLFTSGSTGRPKANVHTHRDFAFNAEVYARRTVGYRADDVTVSVPRLYFGYATGTNLFFPFRVGATTALASERPTAETIAAAIERDRPTIVTNVPTMMGKLIEHDEARAAAGRPRLELGGVRFHLSAGEALPPALLERFVGRFGGEVYDGIGSAEMFHIYCSNRPGDVKPGSLGKVVEGYELKVLPADAEGPGSPALPVGETGVLWVRGDSVALGYFQDRDASWATFHGHWCRTGDLFRIDEAGYLWFSGRADDLFKVSGLFVSPIEVEDCLLAHPAVSQVAVVPDEDAGLTKPRAFVVVREAARSQLATPEGHAALVAALQVHVKTRLARHKYPRWIDFVDDLPKNDRGKIDRKALKRGPGGG